MFDLGSFQNYVKKNHDTVNTVRTEYSTRKLPTGQQLQYMSLYAYRSLKFSSYMIKGERVYYDTP